MNGDAVLSCNRAAWYWSRWPALMAALTVIDTELSGSLARPEPIRLMSDRRGWGKQRGCLPAPLL